MHPDPAHTAPAHGPFTSAPGDAVGELAYAHARTLEKAVAREFERQARRMPFGTTAAVCGLAAELMHEFAEDLLNDLLMLADRQSLPAAQWVMGQLTGALVDGTVALEEAAPPGARLSVANVLQICRVDFEWRCRAALGLPSTATFYGDPSWER